MATNDRSVRRPKRPAPADGLGEPAARVLRRFRAVFNAVKAHFRAVERKTGVAGAQVWVLSVVDGTPGIGVGGIARAMDIHQSTASNLVKALAEQGLVTSKRDDVDRRAVHLHLSAKGQRILRRAPGPVAGVLPQALGNMDARTLGRLDRDLGKLIAMLGPDLADGKVPLGQPDR
jgi:DNA-binding MarR family transcriptional regulator